MKLITPGGAKALVAENLALKQQLFTLNRRRLRSPALTTFDRAFFGVLAQLISPNRIKKIAVVLKPATIINFHKALVNHKLSKLYCTLSFSAGTDPASATTAFTYDALDRLLSRTEASGTAIERGITYAYDKVGNQLTKTRP